MAEGKGSEDILDAETRAKVEGIKGKLGLIQQRSKEWTHCGQWLKSGVVRYTSPDGKERPYEIVERTTRKGNTDAVDVIATIQSTNGAKNKILLVAVYRPPVDRVSIEAPSGLVNSGESLEQAAVRELAEETGCQGDIKTVGPEVHIDPWKSTESTAVCIADIRTSSAAQTLDEDEFLEPLELPLENLASQLELLHREYGFVIDSRLYYFALGLQMAPTLLQK